jgi:hypothetical protein
MLSNKLMKKLKKSNKKAKELNLKKSRINNKILIKKLAKNKKN